MEKIILITGGQRSGKSTYAEKLALSLSPRPVYLATAHIWDEEFRERVAYTSCGADRNGPTSRRRNTSAGMMSPGAWC